MCVLYVLYVLLLFIININRVSVNKHLHLLKIINVPRHGKRDLKSRKLKIEFSIACYFRGILLII